MLFFFTTMEVLVVFGVCRKGGNGVLMAVSDDGRGAIHREVVAFAVE